MSRMIVLGAFILGSLLILGVAVFFIGQKDFLFSRTYRLYSPFDNVAGLVNGAQVRSGGIPVGTVKRIHLPRKPGDKVFVEMNVKTATREVIRKDSVASILTEGLLGNKYVSISFGSDRAERVNDGDVIRSEPPVDLSDLIEKSRRLIDTTESTMKNVQQATAHLQSITRKIDGGEGTLGNLVNSREVYQNLNQTTAEARAGVQAFEENMQALRNNFLFKGYFKERGYADSTELAKYQISKLPKKAPIKQFVFYAKDIFESDNTARLKRKELLTKAGDYLQQNQFSLAAVTGYRSVLGENEKNLELSQAQSMVVRKYLIENFKIDDTKIKTKPMGEDKQSGKDSRVEILVYR